MLQLVLAAMFALIAAGVHAQGEDELLVVNGTADMIVRLVASPPGLGFWSDNLVSRPLRAGDARSLKLAPFGGQCVQDIRATFENSNIEAEWRRVKVCGVEKLGLFVDGDNRTFVTYR